MKIPRLMITAASSGSGKTLCTCGLLQALKNRSLDVVSFKCGPDYIDPMFHTKVIGTKSRNLDTFFTDEDTTRFLLQKNAAQADVAVIEGVMGYYDGLAGISVSASAWDLADTTKTPAVLLVNCKGMSVSIVPFIKGFLEYKKDSHIKGVILNRISGMLYPRVKEMIEKQLPVKVYGYLPELKDCLLESRHLGLVLPEEIEDLQMQLDTLAEAMEKSVDIDGLLQLAAEAEELEAGEKYTAYEQRQADAQLERTKEEYPYMGLKIGVARDEAFCFFYEDNLDWLREQGAELVEFSPLHDAHLPKQLDGLDLKWRLSGAVCQRLKQQQNDACGYPYGDRVWAGDNSGMRRFHVSAGIHGGYGGQSMADGRCDRRTGMEDTASDPFWLYYPAGRYGFWTGDRADKCP